MQKSSVKNYIMASVSTAAIQQTILNARFLPLFTTGDMDIAKTVVQASYKAGIKAFEFTARTENSLQLFTQLKQFCAAELPELLLGIGTIKNKTQAQQFMDAGADFFISPLLLPELFDITQQHQKLWIPGCATATEIGTAENWGLSLVKVFPARQLGGPPFIKAIKAVFPNMHLLVTGGVEPAEADLRAWFESGAAAAGIGSQLFPQAMLRDEEALYGHLKKITGFVEASKQSLAK
jgi:2-dehydro-3-deoxyphosphogluconate aldolase / (4S)-4-hydroxy-2-oxoglutarate aldolase